MMNIRGLIKFSLVDYAGHMACVVFVGGCNFRCPFCHNPALVFDPESQPLIEEDDFLVFLDKRRGKLDGVVFSGGEPSLRKAFPRLAEKIKVMGFDIKLDTNGSKPEFIRKHYQAGLIDALGIDYKGPKRKYALTSGCGTADVPDKVLESISYAVENNIPLDVRTTVHKKLLNRDDLETMSGELRGIGVGRWTLQQFHPVDIIDDSLLTEDTYADRELVAMAEAIGDWVKLRGIRQLLGG